MLKEHKNAKKGKGRVVYFPPEVLAVLTTLAARHPTGPLFRNTRDAAWKRDTVQYRTARASATLGVAPFTAYSLRATWVTNALVKGVPVEVVAELAGTSAKIIHQHYAAVHQKTDALRAAAVAAVS